MTAGVNGSQCTRILFQLFGIDHTITSSSSNDSVAFQSFTISRSLNRGYKSKVINLTPKRNTMTSNEKENE